MFARIQARADAGRVLALGGLSSFGPLALDLYLPGLPSIAADLDSSLPVTQLSLSACMVGLALGQLIAGPMTERHGRRPLLIAGVAVFALSAALCAVAPTIEVLLGLRLLSGLSGGVGIVIARAMARDLYQGPVLARVYAQLMLISNVAPVLGPVAAGQVLQFTDWRGLFALLAGIGLLLTITAVSQTETLPPDRRSDAGAVATIRTLGGLLRDRTFLVPGLILGFGMCSLFTYLAMASFVVQQYYGLPAQTFAAISATNGCGIIAFAWFSAANATRIGPRRLLKFGVGLACVAAILLVAGVIGGVSPIALLPPLFVLVSCSGLIGPNATALALDGHGDHAGSASALAGLSHFGLAAAVPPAVSALFGVSPLAMAGTALGTSVAAAVCLFALPGPSKERAPTPVPAGAPVALADAGSTALMDADTDRFTARPPTVPPAAPAAVTELSAAERELEWYRRIAERARLARLALEETDQVTAVDPDRDR